MEKEKKITVEIVATNVVASRVPNSNQLQRRRSGKGRDREIIEINTAMETNDGNSGH